MLRLLTRQSKLGNESIGLGRRATIHGVCPWCRVRIADMSRLPAHLQLLHPLSAEFDALQRRTDG